MPLETKNLCKGMMLNLDAQLSFLEEHLNFAQRSTIKVIRYFNKLQILELNKYLSAFFEV